MIIVVCGLQGSGKTEAARLIAQKINGIYLSTDLLRKEQIYHLKARMSTYEILFESAKELLKRKRDVVLDGTFYKEDLRQKVKEMAKKFKLKIHFVEVICNESKIKERIETRFENKTSESKANFQIYLRFKKLWQPIKERHAVIDNSGDLENLRSQIENCYLRLAWSGQNHIGKGAG